MIFGQNVNIRGLNTFGINATARYFSRFRNSEDLCLLLREGKKIAPDSKILILGGGSNLLLTKDFDGIVLKNDTGGIGVVSENEDHVYVKAGAGINWHEFILFCINNDLAGAENLSLIPGSVGASPMQNIGAYGVELKDIFHELEAFSIQDNEAVVFNKTDCAFGYRESLFKHRLKNKFVITSVTFRLNKVPVFNTSYGAIEKQLEENGVTTKTIKAVSDAVISIRRSKLPDPKVIGNAGSFFKNPTVGNELFKILKESFPGIIGYAVGHDHTKLAAGWMIEKCGWKGFRKGDAGCHDKQALVLVNYGNAKGEDILELSEKIINSVKMEFGVLLEREVNIV